MVQFKLLSKKALAATLTAIMTASTCMMGSFPAMAADTYTYDAPTQPMKVDGKIITATAHRAASPILGILGCNATSGFGMINGAAPTNLEQAKTKAALGIWGTTLNDSPDPYYWNYFYNFYASENGKETTTDALINASVAASPGMADKNLVAEYGNISASLYTRPQIVIGCSATSSGTDTTGYKEQLDTIHSFSKDSEYYKDGDENYNPQLVPYQMTYLTDMIRTMYDLADAMDTVTKNTGSVGRYGDPQIIASDYEKYVYGTSAYVMSEIAKGTTKKKTVAVVTAINDDGTYTIANQESNSSTSKVRYVEYTSLVSDNLANKLDKTTVSAEELMQADAIILNINGSGTYTYKDQAYTSLSDYFAAISKDLKKNPMVIANYPNSLYGISMNSVENAMGLGYMVGYLYSDVLDINPVDMCAYFYERFYHISDRASLATVVKTNFGSVILPDGISGTLSNNYSKDKVEALLTKGLNYYDNNKEAFKDTYITSNWKINWTSGIGANGKEKPSVATATVSKINAYTYTGSAVKPSVTVKLGSKTLKAGTDYTVAYSNNTKAGTATVKITGTGEYTGTKSVNFTINKASIAKATISSIKAQTYNGKAKKPSVTVKLGSKTLKAGTDYTVSYSKNTSAGKATAKVTAKGNYTGTKTKTFTINKAKQTISTASKTTVTYKKSTVAKKAKTFSIKAKAKGSVSYKVTKGSSKNITVSKTGKVTVKKGAKKGTYKVTVTAKATTNYLKATKTITVKVK